MAKKQKIALEQARKKADKMEILTRFDEVIFVTERLFAAVG